MIYPRFTTCMIIILSTLSIHGCVPLAAGGVAGIGYLAAQERTVGEAVDDTTIWAKIKELYAEQNSKNLLLGVNIEVIEGRVHLTGSVTKEEAKIEAVRLAWQVKGVKEVINEIQIQQPEDRIFGNRVKNFAQDNWIGTQLRAKMLVTKDIQSRNYSIEVLNRVIYLMGIAEDQAELDEITTIASTISGVERVVSYVTLRNN